MRLTRRNQNHTRWLRFNHRFCVLCRNRFTLPLCVIAVLLTASCSLNPVVVTKETVAVKKQYLEDIADKKPLRSDETALTTWKFGCQIDVDFDILEKTKFKPDDYMVTLRIRKVHLMLSLPITVWISKDATEEVVRHEEAHVQICKLVYDKADKAAFKAAQAVINKSYQASGKTIEDACKNAVAQATEDVSDQYHSTTAIAIRRMSAIFDEMDRKNHEDAAVMLDKAFEKYRREEGHFLK